MEVVDSEVFQRLRRLKQLGLTYLIYPSATHTRFDHSLGCMKIADEMVKAINNNIETFKEEGKEIELITPEQQKIVRYAALLHDIGNIPFGHTLEDETKVIKANQDSFERINQAMSSLEKIITEDIGKDGLEILMAILVDDKEEDDKDTSASKPKARKPGESDDFLLGKDLMFLKDIVKNTICADLIDYVQRDAYFCNLNLDFGDRFLQYLFIGGVNKRVAIRSRKPGSTNPPRMSVFSELVQLIWNRCLLAERVYFHHAKMSTAAMLSRAMSPIVDNTDFNIEQKVVNWGDEELFKYLLDVTAKTDCEMLKLTNTLINNILNRKLYKTVCYIENNSLNNEYDNYNKTGHDNILKVHKDFKFREKQENLIAEAVGLQPGKILIYCPNTSMNLKHAEMYVYYKDDKTPQKLCDLNNETLIWKQFNNIQNWHKALWQLRIFISPELDVESHRDRVKQAAAKILGVNISFFKPKPVEPTEE